MPYFYDENCKVNQIKTKKVSGFWDLNYWEKEENFVLDIKKYNFAKNKYYIFVCRSEDCINEKTLIIKTLDNFSFKNEITLFNRKTLGSNGEKFLLLNILN